MGLKKHAVIVGGGVVGVTSAWALARRGWHVDVLDGRDLPGSGTSLGCARQLSYSYTDALASPAILPTLPRAALGLDPAFRLSLPRDPAWFDWIIRFLRNCTTKQFRDSTRSTLRLAQLSQLEMDDLLEQYPIAFDHKTPGKMLLYRDDSHFAKARRVMEFKIANGARQEALSAAEVVALEPSLDGYDGLVGAIYAPQDQSGDCAMFTRALMALATREYGASYRGGVAVTAIEGDGDGAVVRCEGGDDLVADVAVVCGGHVSNGLLAPHGHRLPIMAMKGYSFLAPVGAAAPQASVTDSSRRIVYTNLGDRMLVAGFADLGDASATCDPGRIAKLIETARAALPQAADYEHPEELWCGHRPTTPDSQPVTRQLEPWLAVNSGHGMLGWTLAMGSARRLASAIDAH